MSQYTNAILADANLGWEDKIVAIRNEFNSMMAETMRMAQLVQAGNDEIQRLRIRSDNQAAVIETLRTEAPPPRANVGGDSGSSCKVEVFADPGDYEGNKAKFEEWWSKMKGWLHINRRSIAPRSNDAVMAVLSRLKGPKAGNFAQVRRARGEEYTWQRLENEIEHLFRATNMKDWATDQLNKLTQGNTPTDDFLVRWESLW